jgi:hypothetical protein
VSDQPPRDPTAEQEEGALIRSFVERFFPSAGHDPLTTSPQEVEFLGEGPPPDVFADLEAGGPSLERP